MKTITKRILGIDPGTNVLGFAVIDASKTAQTVVEMGVVTFKHISDEHAVKLRYIHEQITDLIQQYKPTEMAIEAPFYGKNVQSMLKLGRAQGVAMAAAIAQGLEIAEYPPKRVKQAVTGSGNASKEQVAGMCEVIFKQKFDQKYFDATDALSVALCHFYTSDRALPGGKVYKDWKAFAKDKGQI
jgi:crossover junction endodeoxyribonuclease RuvC